MMKSTEDPMTHYRKVARYERCPETKTIVDAKYRYFCWQKIVCVPLSHVSKHYHNILYIRHFGSISTVTIVHTLHVMFSNI